MRKCHFTGSARFAAFGLAVLFFASAAWAAGEWEWTAGQGWIQGAGVSRPTPKEQLHYAYELEQRGEFMDSARQYFLLVQNFPSSQEAGVGLQRLARCLFEMENYWTSYKAIEQVIETYPNTGRMSDLVEIELRIAKKLMVSQTPDILSGNEANNRDFNIRRALQIVDSVIEHDPYGPVAAEAYLVKGEGHLFINEINQARTAFETIRDEFPRSDYLERARLGILTCDSLVGQARSEEVREQMEVVREAERERADQQRRQFEEDDDVEAFIRTTNEVEAAKMMEQANQYHQMGTRDSRKSAEFLYKEIARRYPDTPQGEEARERMGNVKIPKEQNKVVAMVKGINLNPFTYNKDPDPPWIVPQLKAEDMVMVDSGLGPISGVPETGAPRTDYSATVRPASLRDQDIAMSSGGGNFSPASAAPNRAPEFIDGSAPAAPLRTYSSSPEYPSPPVANPFGPEPSFPAQAPAPSRNPLSSISDSDLILPGGGSLPPSFSSGLQTSSSGGFQQLPQQQFYNQTPPPAAPAPAPSGPPSLGSPLQNIPYSDLVGLPPSTRSFNEPPLPDFTPGYDSYNSYGGYQQPGSQYPDQSYQYQPDYSQPQSFPVPAPPVSPSGNTGWSSGSNGGWTLGEDFR